MVQSFLEKTGFRGSHREFVSQLGFPSEVVREVKKMEWIRVRNRLNLLILFTYLKGIS